MKFLTGLSLETWLHLCAGIVIALLLWQWNARGNTIDDLRTEIATERTGHAVTRASLASVQGELARQNDEIERQRADAAQAKLALAAAIELSAGSQDTIERLVASSRVKPSGVCLPSESARSVWP